MQVKLCEEVSHQKWTDCVPEIVQVLDRVHGQPGKRLDVSVPVVEGVNVLVHCLDVDEPVGEVEVELSVEGHQEAAENEQGRVGLGGKCHLVGHEGYAVRGAAIHVDALPNCKNQDSGHSKEYKSLAIIIIGICTCVLHHTHQCVPRVVQHLAQPVLPVGHERPFRPAKAIEDTVPEAEKAERYSSIDKEPDELEF